MELTALLPSAPGLDPAEVMALVLASAGTSFITAAFGIGGGALLLALLATLVPPAALIPVHGIVQTGSNLGRFLLFLRWVHWPALPAFAAGTLAGSAAGGLLVVELPASTIQIAVGAFVIWSVLARPPRWLNRAPAIVGVISSFLTMFVGATGVFVASFTKSFDLERHAHVATHAALMVVQHGLKAVIFGLLGFGFGEWAGFILAMIAAGALGTWAGRHVLTRINERRFRFALDALLILISLRLIWAGLSGLEA
jgi:uncharacterized membrane protein YfcA